MCVTCLWVSESESVCKWMSECVTCMCVTCLCVCVWDVFPVTKEFIWFWRKFPLISQWNTESGLIFCRNTHQFRWRLVSDSLKSLRGLVHSHDLWPRPSWPLVFSLDRTHTLTCFHGCICVDQPVIYDCEVHMLQACLISCVSLLQFRLAFSADQKNQSERSISGHAPITHVNTRPTEPASICNKQDSHVFDAWKRKNITSPNMTLVSTSSVCLIFLAHVIFHSLVLLNPAHDIIISSKLYARYNLFPRFTKSCSQYNNLFPCFI